MNMTAVMLASFVTVTLVTNIAYNKPFRTLDATPIGLFSCKEGTSKKQQNWWSLMLFHKIVRMALKKRGYRGV